MYFLIIKVYKFMKYIILVILIPLVLTGCIKFINNTKPMENIVQNSNEVQTIKYNLAELAKHNTAKDCWLLINDKVYDVTQYIADAKHPGGAAILEGCGKANGTELFATRPMGSGTSHSDKAYSYLENFFIATLEK